ncbi:hypothetical protein OIU78_027942 [Salix suchowensis]|nr:hypothetical protein OIU78_027942 [Salix suchowensis]
MPPIFSLSSIHCTSQWITCDVCNYSTTETIRITFVYGRNTPAERRPLWDYISSHSQAFSHNPWILLGDFNSIMHSDQREGGATSWLSHSEDFQKAAYLAQLIVIPYQGLKFTWHNGQNGAQNIQKKLDWVLGNSSLLQCWPSTSATFLPRTVSDHSAAVVMLRPPMKPISFQFKFLNLWTSRDEFLPTVSQAWNIEVLGDPMIRLAAKLKSVKVALKAFHKQHSSHISSRVLEAKKNWEQAQFNLDRCPRDALLINEERDKASVITRLKDADGRLIMDPQAIGNMAVTHFKNILSSSSSAHIRDISQCFPKRMSEEASNHVGRPITKEEIKEALFSISDGKAPGPDGFTASFFKQAWELINHDFTNDVLYFFSTG